MEPVRLVVKGDAPIACSLSGDQMDGRLADWRDLLTHVRGREALLDGVRLDLDATVAAEEVARLAQAENGCCSFFSFAITVDARGLGLEVRAPESGQEVLAALFTA